MWRCLRKRSDLGSKPASTRAGCVSHGCRSGTGSDRAPTDPRSSSTCRRPSKRDRRRRAPASASGKRSCFGLVRSSPLRGARIWPHTMPGTQSGGLHAVARYRAVLVRGSQKSADAHAPGVLRGIVLAIFRVRGLRDDCTVARSQRPAARGAMTGGLRCALGAQCVEREVEWRDVFRCWPDVKRRSLGPCRSALSWATRMRTAVCQAPASFSASHSGSASKCQMRRVRGASIA
jgi:hypothetical protein